MTVNNAKEMLCPYTHTECKVDKCMSWVMTVNGKKEIHRYRIPYDTYPMEAGREHKRLKAEGYEEIGRDLYARYEEAYEGYCKLVDFNKEMR